MTWRDQIKVHPAADLFPMMDRAELQALADDIKANGLRIKPVFFVTRSGDRLLLDGRNRYAAADLAGIDLKTDGNEVCEGQVDPYAFVLSANIHRRHLTAEQKRDLIAKLLAAQPEKSDRAIAATVKASPSTVGAVRRLMEQRGKVSKSDTRTGRDGVAQPAHKAAPHVVSTAPSAVPSGENVINLPLGPPARDKTPPINPLDALRQTVDCHWGALTYAEQEQLIDWLIEHRAEPEPPAAAQPSEPPPVTYASQQSVAGSATCALPNGCRGYAACHEGKCAARTP